MKYPGILIIFLVSLVIAENPVLLIVPGERVGPVSIFMSREELSEAVDDEFLVDKTIQIGEGYTTAATLVFSGTDKELEIQWDDQMSSAERITVIGEACETEVGIHNGMSLTSVDSILGEFRLLGFAWDYEGCADFSETSLGHGIRAFFYPVDLDTPDLLEAWESVLGDEWFSSRDPGMISLNPRITSIFIYRSFD